jgi:hypothetical protein
MKEKPNWQRNYDVIYAYLPKPPPQDDDDATHDDDGSNSSNAVVTLTIASARTLPSIPCNFEP